MPNFEANVMNIQQRMGRRLSAQELRLLQLWDSISQGEFTYGQQPAAPANDEPSNETQYEGRFKIASTNGHYEVFFVCSTAVFRGVAIASKEDVLAFLTQPDIDLDPLLVRQGIAGAEKLKPTQINFPVTVAESVLRSMGFEQN